MATQASSDEEKMEGTKQRMADKELLIAVLRKYNRYTRERLIEAVVADLELEFHH